jgi:hypothetical protein
LSRSYLTGASLEDLPHDDVINLRRRDPGAFKGSSNRHPAERCSALRCQGTLETTHWGARPSDNH